VRVDYLNLALRLSRGEESRGSLEAYQERMGKGRETAIAALGIPPLAVAMADSRERSGWTSLPNPNYTIRRRCYKG
jgi:hypothetical protein